VFGYAENRPVHVVIAGNQGNYFCIVVTAYVPGETLWADGFRDRR